MVLAPSFALFEDIAGGSTNAQHQGWMDVTSLIGGSVVATSTTPGGSSSAVAFGPITLIKAIDRASPLIFEHAGKGLRTGRVFIDVCSPGAGGGLACNVNYTLDTVGVTSVSGDASLDGVSEAVSLQYSRITQPITAGTNQTRFCWDVALNRCC